MSTRRNPRVLIVDDERDMVVTLKDILELSGYEVEVAFNGVEAIERARESSPDCVLMDIRMPGVGGIDAFRKIKQFSPSPYVIFMTGYANSSVVAEARREGAMGVLVKPLDMGRTLNLLKAASGPASVLVVDDDPDCGTTLKDALSLRNFTVEIATDLEEAVAAFKKDPNCVVILDLEMKERSGLEALASFKAMNPRAIVILMSALTEHGADRDETLERSANATFMKPVDVEELVRTIRNALVWERDAA